MHTAKDRVSVTVSIRVCIIVRKLRLIMWLAVCLYYVLLAVCIALFFNK